VTAVKRTRQFKIGDVYFTVGYQDPELCRPIVLSYEYLGRDIAGEPIEEAESGHYFKYLPGFWSEDGHDSDIAETPHFLTEQQLGSMKDIDGLIAELGEVRERLSKRR
jgi:hypothetical protein